MLSCSLPDESYFLGGSLRRRARARAPNGTSVHRYRHRRGRLSGNIIVVDTLLRALAAHTVRPRFPRAPSTQGCRCVLERGPSDGAQTPLVRGVEGRGEGDEPKSRSPGAVRSALFRALGGAVRCPPLNTRHVTRARARSPTTHHYRHERVPSSFKILPDPVLFPDYYFYIRHPVALSDMARAMDSGRYSLADMQRDIRRMISNAKKYNKPEAVVYQDSLELEVRGVSGPARKSLRLARSES